MTSPRAPTSYQAAWTRRVWGACSPGGRSRNGADDPANQPSAEGLEHGHTFQVGKHMFWVKQEQHGEHGCVALIVWLANMLKTCPGDTKKHQWTFTSPGWVHERRPSPRGDASAELWCSTPCPTTRSNRCRSPGHS